MPAVICTHAHTKGFHRASSSCTNPNQFDCSCTAFTWTGMRRLSYMVDVILCSPHFFYYTGPVQYCRAVVLHTVLYRSGSFFCLSVTTYSTLSRSLSLFISSQLRHNLERICIRFPIIGDNFEVKINRFRCLSVFLYVFLSIHPLFLSKEM